MQEPRTEITGDETFWCIFDREPKLTDLAGAFRPMAIFTNQVLQMLLISKARKIIIGLRLKIGAQNAAFALGFKHRQAGLFEKSMNEGGDENGFARTGKAGDA